MIIINPIQVAFLHKQIWVSLLFIEKDDYQGALLHIECDQGYWKFDFLYLKSLVDWIKEKRA